MLTAATKPEFGDYQCNVAMPLGKAPKMKPRDIAASIVERVSGIEYERYVIDELRVGVKDAVSRTEPSALRSHFRRRSGRRLEPRWCSRRTVRRRADERRR